MIQAFHEAVATSENSKTLSSPAARVGATTDGHPEFKPGDAISEGLENVLERLGVVQNALDSPCVHVNTQLVAPGALVKWWTTIDRMPLSVVPCTNQERFDDG